MISSSPLETLWSTIGAGMQVEAMQHAIAPEVALAAWYVEAGDLPYIPGKPILRFECHKFWEHWGRENETRYDLHFQCGGRNGVTGASWTNHKFRLQEDAPWQNFHGQQDNEYAAFACATDLAGLEIACLSSSFGGPQILGSNFAAVGYESATALFNAFAGSLDAQFKAFFAFCENKSIISALIKKDWVTFASVYNGPGKALSYASHLNDAYLEALVAVKGQSPHPSLQDKRAFDYRAFSTFISGLGLKHFSAAELLFRGQHHAETGHKAYGLNRFPPQELWPNIAGVARVLDTFRATVATPVTLTSIYRSQDYNTAVGGSAKSLHQSFAAIDFVVRGDRSPSHWADELRKLRNDGLFSGAVGLHGTAIHVDARGVNVDF